MKVGLLVLLAVAVVVPSLSEARIVTRCELKEKLDEAIVWPKRLLKFKEKILAMVICAVERKSGLNTELVKVYGNRITTTTKPKPTKPKPTKPPGTKPKPTKPTTTKPTTTTPTTTKPTTTTPTTTKPTTTTNPTVPELTQATSGSARRKREADTISEESETTGEESDQIGDESDPTGDESNTISEESEPTVDESDPTGKSSEITDDESDPTDDESEITEDESDPTNDDDPDMKEIDKVLNEEGSMFDEDEMEEEDNEMGDELDEGGKREKRSWIRRWRPKRKWRNWSLAYYGIFQMHDRFYCDSGYQKRTRNVCKTSCNAFTDDNIMDDIACFVKSRYWWTLLRKARYCRLYNFFDKCE